MPYLRLVLLSLLLATGLARAVEPFVVSDIRVEGIQRISTGTLFNYLPIKVGDRVDDARTAEALKALFATGFFLDVRLERDGDVLLVIVSERPAIAEVTFEGNKALETEKLATGLRDIGLAEGQVFNNSLLDKIQQELTQIYFSQGRYGVTIDPTVTPLERNRVAVRIAIDEGEIARIKQINLVGNTDFGDATLLELFELTTPTMFSFLTKTDQYSKQKLSADLERLQSHYLDRGYINFKIDSTQVSITPDRQDVYITINLTEGKPFKVSTVKLAGDLVLPEAELIALVTVRPGDTFSRRDATASSAALSRRLGDEGFAFANVNIVPAVDQQNRQVAVTLFVDPGRRVYVRRIQMAGNHSTRDIVLRREMRQMESAWFSTSKVNRSRERLDRLGYFQEVNVETPPVPGEVDQVDVNFSVVEAPSGNISVGVGYSQSEGPLFTTSLNQDNFFGTGKRVSLQFNNSSANTTYSFAFENPYYTVDGISRSFGLFYREADASEINITDYQTDAYGGNVAFGIPLSETNRIRVQGEYRHTKFKLGGAPASQLIDFVADNGSDFDTFALSASWSHDTRNRAIFADSGGRQRIFTTLSLPGGDLEYYKVSYDHTHYWPFVLDTVLSLDGDIAFGDAYGDTTTLPPWERYYAGGLNCVRGYEANTLGTKDSNGDPLGGNLKLCGRAEIIIPLPMENARQVRLVGFFDIGNVYDTGTEDVDTGLLRYSTGLGLTWLSPVGPMTFSYGIPFNQQTGDKKQNFQFQLGASF